MADYLPQISSNWTTATWITAFSNLTAFAGTPPMSADDVYADGKTITIDTNINVASLRTTTAPRTGGVAGGGFRATNNTLLIANLLAGTSTCLTFTSASPNFFTLVGNVTGSSTNINTPCINNTSTGIINITGNIFGSDIGLSNTGSYQTIQNINGGTLNIVGDVISRRGFSGASSTPFVVIDNRSETSTINIRGNLFGGTSVGGDMFNYNGNMIIWTFGSVNIIGNITMSDTNAANTIGIGMGGFTQGGSGSGRINIVGNLYGGAAVRGAFFPRSVTSAASLTIVGNVSAGTTGVGLCFVAGTADTLNTTITGDLHGATGGTTAALEISRNRIAGSTVTINGNVYGRVGNGISVSTDVPVTVNGSVVGGSVAGFSNTGSNSHFIKRAVGGSGGLTNPTGGTAVGVSNIQNGLVYVQEFEYGQQGASPVSGPVFIDQKTNSVTVMRSEPLAYNPITLFTSLSAQGLFPPASSVRVGTVYGNGDFTGTMIVPTFSAVQVGVPVDDTVGIFLLSPDVFWQFNRQEILNYPDSIGYRIANLATIPSVGQQIASFNLYPPMSTFNIL